MSTLTAPRPINPFAGSRNGVYRDDVVVVVHSPALLAPAGTTWTAQTEHFAIGSHAGRLVLAHRIALADIGNDIVALLDDELFSPGWAGGSDAFERLMTGIVLSLDDDPLVVWERFYRNTLLGIENALTDGVEVGREGTVAGFAPVYERAAGLVAQGLAAAGRTAVQPRSVLDVGCCFGFFPLRLAAADPGLRVSAADVSAGTCDLLTRLSLRLGTPVTALPCDAAAVPLPPDHADVVTALHLLEHLEPAHGDAVLAETLRLARQRVVVAVPFEDEPDEVFGHVRTFDVATLKAAGRRAATAAHAADGSRWTTRVSTHHGGWLVLDRR